MAEVVPAHSALTEDLKSEIQEGYRAWLGNRGFRPRRGQREMIAVIARALTHHEDRVCVVEAGTGTGKTAAYCLAAIPIARALDKRVVIATATVALQEQVAFRDLPDLKRHAGLDFTSTLAKGRGRYVCLKRLDDRIAYDASHEAPLFAAPQAGEVSVYRRFQSSFADGSWDGDLDSWEEGVESATWAPVTNDRAGCTAGRCGYYHQCPFFKARQEASEADVVVANQDLMLADLTLGGGVVLPDPAETIFVLDEAHHLPEKTRDHFTVSARLKASREWLDQLEANMDAMAQRFNRPRQLERAVERLAAEGADLGRLLADAEAMLRDLPFTVRDERTHVHRFPHGEVPAEVAELAQPLGLAFGTVGRTLGEVQEDLEGALVGDLEWDNAEHAETWLPAVSQLAARAGAAEALFTDYGATDARHAARWASRRVFEASEDIDLASAPLDPGSLLREALWNTCYGAVATSATLCAVGTFDRFLDNAGLTDETQAERILSPFDFPRLAAFRVPRMRSAPNDAMAHTEELAALLPELLEQEQSALALFTSWRQFNAVADSLPRKLLERCHLQDTASKQQLLKDHRDAVDAGEPSYLFGLASFAEGVDLPGDYCRHVIIAKIPFAVPDDPVDEAVAEWLEAQGRNPFMELMVPDASLRLVQACGRLIRSDTDTGRITLLDRRIVTKRYGEALLRALPPYRLELD